MTPDEFREMAVKHKEKQKLEEQEFLTRHDYMYFEDCKEGYTYEIDARNFTYAIFHNDVFHGIRTKFYDVFIDTEIHWDKDDHYGTARPQKELEKTPDDVMKAIKFEYDTIKENFTIVYDYLIKFNTRLQ